MKIYSSKKDTGKTSLCFGASALKDNLRIDCLGDLDELNSFLGLAKAAIKDGSIKQIINKLQNDIYVVSSEIATKTQNLTKLKTRLGEERLLWLESQINKLSSRVRLRGCGFLVPGENVYSGILDVCRAVCRRAERKAVSLKRKYIIKNDFILAYLNRLSSLLFVLARILGKLPKSPSF